MSVNPLNTHFAAHSAMYINTGLVFHAHAIVPENQYFPWAMAKIGRVYPHSGHYQPESDGLAFGCSCYIIPQKNCGIVVWYWL